MNGWAGSVLGAGLIVLGLGLLSGACRSGRAEAFRRDPRKAPDDTWQPLSPRSIVECTGTAAHIDAIRTKLGFPAEVFEEAVRPVIEAYGEFVECLSTSEPHHCGDFVDRFMYSIEVAGLALDFRRGQILPPAAAPEAIGEHAQRWTYGVLVAALLHDVGKDSSELRTVMRNREASPTSRPSLRRSFRAGGSTSDHGTRVEVSSAEPELNAKSPVLLLTHFVPAAILEWLAADAGLMRELYAFLSGDEAAQVGAIGALVQRAEAEAARRHAGMGSRATLLSKNRAEESQPPESTMNCEVSSATAATGQGDPEPSSHAAVTGEHCMAEPVPLPFTRSVTSKPEYLEDSDAKRRTVTSQRAGMPAPLGRAPAPSQVVLSGVVESEGSVSDAAHRFMSWLKQGLAEGTLRVNGPRAWVHFVPEGMLLVSPRIFQEFARRFGEDGEGNAGLVGDANVGKLIQRKVLRAGWHVRAEKQVNFHTYQVIHDGRAVSRLSGVLIGNPERFVSPVPSANPFLVRVPGEITLA